MNFNNIRNFFLKFFNENNHKIVPSSSLIPAQDQTLLFTNAGMNQFKDLFLGQEKRSYSRAVSCQKCIRAGGKHNDLDQVGFTERHLTFFEMLGNFSFGDYFKEGTICFSWEFLTKIMNISDELLYVTIYKNDEEAFDIWTKKINIPEKRITRLGDQDNFWQMGDTGPCGPCSEIYVDRGAKNGCKKPSCSPGCSCSRFMEIWNNVFIQYDRQADGTLLPLKSTGVDTGMGLERLAVIMQNVRTIFDTDLFKPILNRIEEIADISYKNAEESQKVAFRVLGDHIRSSCFIISDGCSPSNEGRGYVLRKIIRRAALFAKKLSKDSMLFAKLSHTLIDSMSSMYPELIANKELLTSVLESELDKFSFNLQQGQTIFAKYIDENKQNNKNLISGEQVFKLYDTYGFPTELTTVLAKENDMEIDLDGFTKEMEKQQKQSGKKLSENNQTIFPNNIETKFVGYEKLQTVSIIKWIFTDLQDNIAWLIMDESPFYVESGGQISDKGIIEIQDKIYDLVELKKVGPQKQPAIACKISLNENSSIPFNVHVGDFAKSSVDSNFRVETAKHHTAVHLLQAALTEVVGLYVRQAGSYVDSDMFRFDFTCHKALSQKEIQLIEKIVNTKIQENININIFETTLQDAKQNGVTAFFGEKYNPESVRVVKISNFSAELCGGTHVKNTGNIGCFKIINEMSLAAGTRRIVGVVGLQSIIVFQNLSQITKSLSEQFKSKPEEILDFVKKEQDQLLESQNNIKILKKQIIKFEAEKLIQNTDSVNNVIFIYHEFEKYSLEDLKIVCKEIEKMKEGVYFLLSKQNNTLSCFFICYISQKFQSLIDARKLLNYIKGKSQKNIKGGGNAIVVQGSIDYESNIKKNVFSFLTKESA